MKPAAYDPIRMEHLITTVAELAREAVTARVEDRAPHYESADARPVALAENIACNWHEPIVRLRSQGFDAGNVVGFPQKRKRS